MIFNAVYYACKNALDSGDKPKQVKEITKDYRKAPEKPAEQFVMTRKPAPVADFWQHIPKNEPPKPQAVSEKTFTKPVE